MDWKMKIVKRGEIWLVRFEPVVDSEIGKTRPAVILQNDIGNRHADTTIVAAITGRYKDLPTLVEVEPSPSNGLKQACAVNLSHLRTISKSRLVTRLGVLEVCYFQAIEESALVSLGFRQI